MKTKRDISPIAAALSKLLKPLGFRKSSNRFVRENEETFQVIHIQKSGKSTRDVALVTINLGVYSKELGTKMGDRPYVGDVWLAHWRERIGFVMPQKDDTWWRVESDEDATTVANAISNAVESCVIPTFDKLLTTKRLQDVWISGRSPGQTEFMRLQFLKALEEES